MMKLIFVFSNELFWCYKTSTNRDSIYLSCKGTSQGCIALALVSKDYFDQNLINWAFKIGISIRLCHIHKVFQFELYIYHTKMN